MQLSGSSRKTRPCGIPPVTTAVTESVSCPLRLAVSFAKPTLQKQRAQPRQSGQRDSEDRIERGLRTNTDCVRASVALRWLHGNDSDRDFLVVYSQPRRRGDVDLLLPLASQ